MRTNKFFAVIHCVDHEQALRNARIAFGGRADGVFLINHEIQAKQLLSIYRLVRERYPDRWIGLNLLDLSPSEAIYQLSADVDALWFDDAGVVNDLRGAERTRDIWANAMETRKRGGFKGQLFGGVAFKYVHRSANPARDAIIASPYLDVVTTSGPATGEAPPLEKIVAMREALDRKLVGPLANATKLLAVASGMTPENVRPFLDHVDYFLVATGVSRSPTQLDLVRVYKFAKLMRR